MPDKNPIIYNVNPRKIGPIREWSGADRHDGVSPLIKRAKDLGYNAIWFNPLTAPTRISFEDEQHQKRSRSLYAIRNYFRFSAELSAHPDQTAPPHVRSFLDRIHITHFNEQMAAEGMVSISDKVLNHVARDNPIVEEENRQVDDILRHCEEKGFSRRYIVIDKDNQIGEQSDFPIEDYETKKIIGLAFGQEGEVFSSFHFRFCRNHNFEALNYHGMPD